MSYVQSASASSAASLNAASYALAFSGGNAAGSCLVVDIIWTSGNATGYITVTDSQGNTYASLFGNIDGTTGVSAECWVAPNSKAGSNTVTVTYHGTDPNRLYDIALAIHEYSNVIAVSPVDALNATAWGTGSTVTPGVTTGFAFDLLHCFACATGHTGGTFLTYPPPYQTRESSNVYDAIVSCDMAISLTAPTTQLCTFGQRSIPARRIQGAMIALMLVSSPPSPGTSWLYIKEPGGFVDRSSYLDLRAKAKHSFTSTLRNRGTADLPLWIKAGDSWMADPNTFRGLQVYLYDQPPAGAELVFAGTVDKIEVEWIGIAGDREVTVHLVSFEQCFDALLIPPQAFFYEKAGDIFSSLFGSVANGVPVVLGTVTAPFVVNSLTCDWNRLSETFGQLATLATCIWGVDLPSLSAYLKPVSTTASPYAIQSADVVYGSVKWEQNRQDYRNRQIVRISIDAFSPSSELFYNGGTLPWSFNLRRPAEQVSAAWITLNTQNTATGTFSGQPSPGDTVSIAYPQTGSIFNWAPDAIYQTGQVIIDPSNHVQKCTTAGISGNAQPTFNDSGGTTSDGPGTPNPQGLGGVVWTDLGISGPGGIGASVYTFEAALDNTSWGQVQIGPTAGASCQNLADAINNNQAVAGQTFSWPTWENPLINATSPVSGSTITIQNKPAGAGYIAALATTSSAFSWSGAQTSGGSTTGGTSSLNVAENGSSNTANVYYTPGSSVVSVASLPAGFGGAVQIQYKRYAGDCIICEDTADVLLRAAAESGTGKYQQLVSDTSNTSNTSGLQECQSTLAAFDVAPISFSFTAWKPGIMPGQLLSISFATGKPTGLSTLMNGNYVVQEVTAELIPARPYVNQSVIPGGGHYKYTVTVIDENQIFGYLEFWQGLGGGGSGGGGIVAGSPAAQIGPTAAPASSSGMYSVPIVSGVATPDASQGANLLILTAAACLTDSNGNLYVTVAQPINYATTAGSFTNWQLITQEDPSAAWVALTAYTIGQVVSYGGSFYSALGSTTGNEPDTSPASWSKINSYSTIFDSSYVIAFAVASAQSKPNTQCHVDFRTSAAGATTPTGSLIDQPIS